MPPKIYTKTGDKGKTSLLGGKKLLKSELRIEAYGNIDELNAFVGLLRDRPEVSVDIRANLILVQEWLFNIGSLLATEPGFTGFELPQVLTQDIRQIEQWIDQYSEDLPELKNFILPGGHEVVSLCHVCRTVCRRAERSIIRLDSEEEVGANIIPFINRLSDYFFVISRKMAQLLNVSETPWTPRSADKT